MIKSIFFSYFHPDKGPQVAYQVPDGSVTPSNCVSDLPPLFDFEDVSEFIIPKQELCDRLVSVCVNKYRLLGYPVCLEDRRYERNEFIFNFAIALDEDADWSTYKSVVRKLAKFFKALEEQSGFLSNEVTRSGVYALIEQVLEDLNNYCECMIPINESNAINIKLFPTYAPPPQVRAFHVPVCIVRLEDMMDVNWDLTMQRVIPYIDGINCVRRISELADADYDLTKKCIEHLLYYGCLIMVDIFQFGAIYACTTEITVLVQESSLQEECLNYVATSGPNSLKMPFVEILQLYASLTQGLTLKKWCMDNAAKLQGIDVRRFISFGVVKGFLYRSHKYAVSGDGRVDRGNPLAKYVDGAMHFDEICTALRVSEREVLAMLEGSDVQIVHR